MVLLGDVAVNRLLSGSLSIAYRHIAKPILFRQSPDNVHRKMLAVGSLVQKNVLFRNLTRFALAYDNKPYLSQKLHGIKFNNPIGLSAGFDKNFELPPLIRSIGFGFMEGGSLTLEPCRGNPKPWFYRLPKTKSIVVHAGLANQGVRENVRRIKNYPKSILSGFPLNISVAKTNSPGACSEASAIGDYIGSLRVLQRSGVGDMVTLNISCPNTYGGEPFIKPGKLGRLLAQVDSLKLQQPVFIKMPIDLPWPEFRGLLEIITKHNIAGVIIGNLVKDRSKVDLKDPLPPEVQGGLSGKPTWNLSNNLIRRTYHEYGERLTIIGVGGVFSAKDAYIKIRLGASLVELITGMIYQGPQIIGQINHDLVRLLERDGLTNIAQAIGRDA